MMKTVRQAIWGPVLIDGLVLLLSLGILLISSRDRGAWCWVGARTEILDVDNAGVT